MPAKQKLVDSVFVKGGSLDVHIDSFPQLPDPVNVLVQPDTWLVDVVTKEGTDPWFGFSWDAWQGTGQWFGPFAVFALTILFAWVGRQWKRLRQQKADVAHFRIWRDRILKNIGDQIEALKEFRSAIRIMEAEQPGMPNEILLRYHLEIDLWLSLSPSDMTRVFVLNKQGDLNEKTKDLQDTIGNARSIESNLDHSLTAIKKLHVRYEEFVEEWKLLGRQASELSVSIMERRYTDMTGVEVQAVQELFGKYPVFVGPLLKRRTAIEDMHQELRNMYSNMKVPAYSSLGAAILRMRTALNEIMQNEDQLKALLDKYIDETSSGLEAMDASSRRLVELKDRFFMQIL